MAPSSRLDSAGFLFVGDEDWDGIWRRSQHLVAHLARKLPRARFLFVERPTDLSHGLRAGAFAAPRGPGNSLGTDASLVPGFENVFTMRALKWLPASLPGARLVSARQQAQSIQKQMMRLLPPSPITWVQNQTVADVVSSLPIGPLVYDLTDDWLSADLFSPREKRRLRRLDQMLTASASAILACSTELMNSHSAGSGRIRLLRNGVDYAAYTDASAGSQSPGNPTIGYLGTLHEERLDLDIIEALAARLPAANIVLLGPDHLTSASRHRLLSLANVQILPSVGHEAVPAALAGFDVCILPHRVTLFTDSLDPLKFLEYMAAWRPIVATAVSSARELSHLMDVAGSTAEFADLVARAVDSPDGDRLSRARQYAASNSWDLRADEVISILERLDGTEYPREQSDKG